MKESNGKNYLIILYLVNLVMFKLMNHSISLNLYLDYCKMRMGMRKKNRNKYKLHLKFHNQPKLHSFNLQQNQLDFNHFNHHKYHNNNNNNNSFRISLHNHNNKYHLNFLLQLIILLNLLLLVNQDSQLKLVIHFNLLLLISNLQAQHFNQPIHFNKDLFQLKIKSKVYNYNKQIILQINYTNLDYFSVQDMI